MPAAEIEREFFVTGGTIPPEASSYVERAADRSLLEHLRAGRFCYVLNSRQMGKSSLCVRTMRQLQAEGVRCAFVDLTKIGGRNLTAEQWYAGVGMEIARSLDLRRDVLAYWKEHAHLGPMQRMFGSLREVILERVPSNIAIFFDEIDATRSLSFDVDEFFAAIREVYNRRVQDPVYERLTFCLLGVAVPSDLINTPTSTPFNIGERIILRDFTLEEAMPLAVGLRRSSETPDAYVSGDFIAIESDRRSNSDPRAHEGVMRRIFYWTNGHPYLTQSLCAAAAAQAIDTAHGVDALVQRELLDPKVRETHINLADVGNRALHAGDVEPEPNKFRADLLSAYERAWRGKGVADDEANRVVTLLKLSGIVRSDGRRLYVRNRIYREVFDRGWIRDNMPGQEVRRQKTAYWLGVVRTTAVGAALILIVSTLAARNAWLANRIRVERDRAEYHAYASVMRDISAVWDRHNLTKVRAMLDQTALSSFRGWEWSYWNRIAHLEKFDVETGAPMYCPAVSKDAKTVWYTAHGFMIQVDVPDRRIRQMYPTDPSMSLSMLPDGRHALDFPSVGAGSIYVRDLASGRRTLLQGPLGQGPLPIGDGRRLIGVAGGRITTWDTATGKIASRSSEDDFIYVYPLHFAKEVVAARNRGSDVEVVGMTLPDFRSRDVFEGCRTSTYEVSPDDRWLYAQPGGGKLQLWDMASRRLVWEWADPGGWLTDARFSPDGKWMLATTGDRQERIIRMQGKDTHLVSTIPEAQWGVLSADDSTLVIDYDSGDGASIRFVDWQHYQESEAFSVPGQLDCQSLPNGDEVCATLPDRLLWLDPLTGKPRREVKLPGTVVPGRHLGTARQSVLALRTGAGASLVDCDSGQTLLSGLPAEDAGVPIARIDEGHCLIARQPDAVLELWDLRSKRLDRQIPVNGYATCLAMSHDGRRLAAGLQTGPLLLLDVRDWRSRELYRDPWNPESLRFSADDRYLLAGMNDDYGIVFDLAKGTSVRTSSHDEIVWDLDISPDGTRIATASDDHTVRVWDAETGIELTILTGHTNRVNYVRWTSDGKSIVSWGLDGFRTWSL